MKKHQIAPRALHVVDVANEICSGYFYVSDVEELRNAWNDCVHPGEHDQYFLATGPGTKEALAFGWRKAAPVIRAGVDGADDAIIEYLDVDYIASRFTHVYLGSGDHKIAPRAAELVKAGVKVTIVGRRGNIHHTYYGIGAEIRFLDDHWVLAA